jgi:ribose transport system substrate-binding protein
MNNYTIGLVMKSLNADFFKVMQKGALDYSATREDLNLVCVGTDTQTEVDRQIALVRQLVEQEVDAIVLVPIDSKRLAVPAVEAVRAGIPVVNIDIKLDDDILSEAGVTIPFAGPDNFAASYEVGKLMKDYLKAGDDVAIISGLPSADNAKQRKDGSMKVIEECGYHLVDSIAANWETADAASAYAQIIANNKNLKGVFCGNDAMALGVLGVMEKQGKYLPVVGFDNDDVMRTYLDEKKLIGTVDIFCSQMAVEGINYAIKIIRGELKPEGIYTTPYNIIR